VVEVFTCSILVLNVHSLINRNPSHRKTADPQKLIRFRNIHVLGLACRPERETGESSRLWSKLLNCLTACDAKSAPHRTSEQCTLFPTALILTHIPQWQHQ